MLNALLSKVRTSSARRYMFQARSISRPQRKQNRLNNINSIPKRAQNNTFWDSEDAVSQKKLNPRTYEYSSELFSEKLLQGQHSIDQVNELWELASKYDFIRYSDAIGIANIFHEYSNNDLAKSILHKIDFKQITPSELIQLGEICAKCDALDLVLTISKEFGGVEYNRPVILRVLEACTRYLIGNNRFQESLEVYMKCCVALFKNHQLKRSFYVQNYVNLYGEILSRITDLECVVETTNKVTANDSINLTTNVYFTVIRSLFNVEGNTTRLQMLFELIPDEFKNSKLLSYTFRSYLHNGRPEAARELHSKYSELLNDEDKRRMQEYSQIIDSSPESLHSVFMRYLDTDINYALALLKGAVKRRPREKNDELVESMTQKFIEKSPKGRVSAYNVVMEYHLNEFHTEQFFQTFRKLIESKTEPNEESYWLLLKQFCRRLDLKSAFSLLDVMIEKKMEIKSYQLLYILTTCSRKIDLASAQKVEKLFELLNIQRKAEYFAKMMSVYISMNLHTEAIKIFETATVEPESTMFAQLIRSHLKRKNYKEAQEIFDRVSNGDYKLSEDFYVVMIDYFCQLKDFASAENALTSIIKSPDTREFHRAFEKLMYGYNQNKKFIDATKVFNKLLNLEMSPSNNMLKHLLMALTGTEFVNFGNYARPKRIAEDIMSAYSNNTLSPERKKLTIKIFRPLLKYLTNYYDPIDALSLLESYELATKGDDKSHDFSYLKERIVISAKFDDWATVNAVFRMFLEAVKLELGDGDRPYTWSNLFMPVVGPAAKAHKSLDKQEDFLAILDDFIHAKKFRLNNRNLNDISLTLLGNQKTFEVGLKIIEKKLMGGFIARGLIRGREWFENALPYGVPPPSYNHIIKPPHIYLLDSSYMHVAMQLRHYLMHKSRKVLTKPEKMQVIVDFKKSYPKVYKNFYGTVIQVFPYFRTEILDSVHR